MSTDATEPLDLAPIKVGLANYASGPKNDLTGQMIARDLAHAVPSLIGEVERLRALTTMDDAMIERAMVAFKQKRWHTNMAGDALRADLTAALEAALGVES